MKKDEEVNFPRTNQSSSAPRCPQEKRKLESRSELGVRHPIGGRGNKNKMNKVGARERNSAQWEEKVWVKKSSKRPKSGEIMEKRKFTWSPGHKK